MRTKTILLVAIIAASFQAATVRGQIVYDQPGSSSIKYYYSSWSLGGDDSFSQGTAALSGFVPIADNLEARYYFATAFNSLDLYGVESDLSGIGDLRVQVSRSFSGDRLLLSGGLNLPTGKQGLDPDDEGPVIGFLSRDYITVPMRRYGEGFGFNLQLGGAAEVGRYKCGMSAVFNYTGTYEPYDGSGDYNPGNSFAINATSNAVLKGLNFTGDLGFSYYTKDELEDMVIYRQAPQFTARLTATYPGKAYAATLGVKMALRGRNTRYNAIDGAIDSQLKKYGDEFDVFLRVAKEVGGWRISGLAGTRQIMESEEEFGRTSLFNLGCDVSRSVSRRLDLDLGFQYHTGSTDGGDTDLDGFLVSSGLNVTF